MTDASVKFDVNSYQASFFKKWGGLLKAISSTDRYIPSTTHLTSAVRSAE
jgi:hypothetical protein